MIEEIQAFHSNPNGKRVQYAQVLTPKHRVLPNISPRAIIGDGCMFAAESNILEAVVGDRTLVGIKSTVANGCYVGLLTAIHSMVKIHENVTMGANCKIHDGVYIMEGTSLANLVTISDDVFVGVYVTIGDGVFVGAKTAIYDYAFISLGCSIGHSCIISGTLDKNVVVGDETGVSGRASVGAGTTIGGGVRIGGGSTVGRSVTIGTGATVTDGSVVPDNTVIENYAIWSKQ